MNQRVDDSRLLFAGIDGGGSTTRALIASPDGVVFGRGYAAGSNPSQLGAEVAGERLRMAMNAAWNDAGLQPQPLCAAFCGIAGLSAYAAQHSVAPLWSSAFPDTATAQIGWDNDLRTALAGGLLGEPGIVLIAGTGSACYARNSSGQALQVGGWGSLLDDVGSGYALGLRLAKHAVRAWEDRVSGSPAVQLFSAQTGARSPAEALQWVRSFADPRPEIARLAPPVFQAWSEGDPFAAAWVEEGADELARLVATAARRLFADRKINGVFAGGLSENSKYVGKVRAAVAKYVNVTLVQAELNATAGAMLLALESRGVALSTDLLKKLRNLSAAAHVDSP